MHVIDDITATLVSIPAYCEGLARVALISNLGQCTLTQAGLKLADELPDVNVRELNVRVWMHEVIAGGAQKKHYIYPWMSSWRGCLNKLSRLRLTWLCRLIKTKTKSPQIVLLFGEKCCGHCRCFLWDNDLRPIIYLAVSFCGGSQCGTTYVM